MRFSSAFRLKIIAVLTGLAGSLSASPAKKSITLDPIGTYTSGAFDQGAAEIVAHDPASQRVFVVNASAATIDVLYIGNPTNPVKVGTVNVTAYGAVAVHDGIIAVAVENAVKTMPGKVVFFGVILEAKPGEFGHLRGGEVDGRNGAVLLQRYPGGAGIV